MKRLGVILITLLTILPLFLWLPSAPKTLSLLNLSRALALAGAVLFSINFMLSARLKFLEPFFGGLNRIYIVHHIVGQIALILLCLHPTLIGLEYMKISFDAAFSVLFPPLIKEPATWFGMASLILLITLLILTLYIKLPYHIWKFTHKFMGVALLLATIHIFLVPSDVSFNLPLRYYILSICSLGLIAYLYRVILGKFLVQRLDYKVFDKKRLGNVTEIKLLPQNAPLRYIPGQFIFIKFKSLIMGGEEHPFSLTSIPSDEFITISPKDSGDYTNKFKDLEIEADAKVEGPFGEFSYLNSPRKKQIWIAGGIGITPFVSMAKSLYDKDGFEIILYYTVSTKKEAVYLKLLESLKTKLPKFKIKLWSSKLRPRLTAEQIKNDINDLKERDIFLCGPPPMMESLRKQFNAIGIRNSHIYSEEFSLN